MNWFNKIETSIQLETWKAVLCGCSGLVNTTRCGNIIIITTHNMNINMSKNNNELLCLWITPLRSLSQQIGISRIVRENDLNFTVGIRNSDSNKLKSTKKNIA